MIDLFGGEAYVHMKELETRPFIVVRQIGIAPGCSHHGYAQRLYDFIYEHAKQDTARYAAMMCFVWKQPSNLASENFHRAVGWKEMETYQFENGGVVGIWARSITHP
jgi:predicted GNAT superfamily acetyltransferase